MSAKKPVTRVVGAEYYLDSDIAERLSALIRAEARTGKFKINDSMLSISGSTKIQMEDILYLSLIHI